LDLDEIASRGSCRPLRERIQSGQEKKGDGPGKERNVRGRYMTALCCIVYRRLKVPSAAR